MEAGTFALQPERIFPNEFTWSGGFYVTPDKAKAQLFGATFLGEKCASHGGVVIMELKLSTSGLKLNEVSSVGRTAVTFGASQSRLGNAVKLFLKKQAPSDALPPDPPSDQGISADDNPAVQKPPIAIPTEDQVQGFLDANPKNFRKENKDAFAAIKGVDVVAASAPLSQGQKSTINHAKTVGMAPLEEPFNQVVLISDKAMKALEFVSQEDLPDCLATQATQLVALLKKINAEE
ncbi:hypothetical protein B0H19DRAFT_377952 [Mycena capillaripes]|nr:hypothetical protein B0H19DRAFT_377952 [Mycena capillaripes]